MAKQNKPIPDTLIDELDGYLVSTYDDDDLPDGAWFQMLVDKCDEFITLHKIKGDSNDAVHQYLDWKFIQLNKD